ncbi:MAG: UDP-4-amino-4,6-dideoxy-N-acetyl-beta-L-altrosamine transaminase [Candidatus Omnitrophica bacterium]|nr:UDP-4-amino-4,6-dideoxy-N-acetyl-beta-L-altrosamine transaminase [Candidatus Omnitrophota bacterium]
MKNISYGRQFIDKRDIKAVNKVLKSDWLTQGPKVKEFENAICEYTGAKYAVAVSNATAALHNACLVGGIGQGDEVITSPITFVASANCVLYCGGKPVFADIQNDTINIDPAEVKNRINKRTKAIIPVHFAGHPANLDEICQIAKKHKLLVIEDAAHALGAEYKGLKIGSCKYSDMAIFSFHPVKSITTGEGGAVLTNRKDLYEKLLIFRNHGITKDASCFTNYCSRTMGSWYYEQQYLGFNYRITDFQCALGLSQLKKLDKFVEKRRRIVNMYQRGLSGMGGITLPQEKAHVKSAWHIYCIRLKNYTERKRIFEKLQKSGIWPQVHYIPVHLQPYYREKFGYREGDYPNAENYYKRAMSIPLYPSMTKRDVKYVIDNLAGLKELR